LEEKAKGPRQNETLQLSVKVSRQGSKIMELENISKSFSENSVINNFSYIFKKSDRIGLAGRNGTGKTTFLNLLTQLVTPDSGNITVGETTKFGYYKQGGLGFKENDRVLDVVKNVADYIEMANGEVIAASQLLTLFLFPPEKQFGLVSKLSGGEKKRLQLMRVLMSNPNFLILDEPSNDLDIDTLNVLEEFLGSYSGVLMLVSHDRYLIDKLTDQLFIFEGNGNIKIYNGNYADYKTEIESLAREEKEKNKPVAQKSTPVKQTTEKKKLSYKEQREYESLETEIEKIERIISDKTDTINQQTDHGKITEIALEIQKLQEELDIKSERWLALAEYM